MFLKITFLSPPVKRAIPTSPLPLNDTHTHYKKKEKET